MSRNQRIFLLLLSFYVIFDFILGSLVGIYIWDKTESTVNILKYYVVLFSSILIFSQVSANLIGKFGAKKIYISSIMIGLFQALSLIKFQNNLSGLIIPLAILSGASIGIQSISYNIVANKVIENSDSTKFFSLKSTLMNLVSIFTVPIIAYLITITGSYNISYMIGTITGLIVITLMLSIDIDISNENYQPFAKLREITRNSNAMAYLWTRLLYGFFNGPLWGIIGIVTFKFVGNVSIWGVIATTFNILTIIGSYLYGKYGNDNTRKLLSAVATLIFSSVALILAINWNFITFLIYQVGLVILNIAFSIYYEKLMFNLITTDEEINKNQKELLGIGEICLGAGRILSISLMIILGFNIDNDIYLRVLFVVIATIPLLIISTLKRTHSFQGSYAILNKI